VDYKKKNLIPDYIELKKFQISVIELAELKDLGYTIMYGLQKIIEANKTIQYLYINFADTLVDNIPSELNKNIALYAESAYEENWTYFTERNGVIKSIHEKAW
jgi:uncharacterized protein YdeI (YjbR/CyaY-like superfamily)